MKTSAEELMRRMELLYENVYNLLSGFQQASKSIGSDISVTIKKDDGSEEIVSINSFQKLQQELTRIDNNYRSLISSDNLSYTVNADGSISQQTKTSFLNAEYLENFDFDGTKCVVDKQSIVNDLVYPTVKIPITIDSKLLSDIRCKIFEINEGWDNIPDNPTLIDIDYLHNNGIIGYKEVERTLTLEKQQVQYFGKFTVESSIEKSSNQYDIVLGDIQYTSLYTLGNSIDLRVNDILVSKTGSSKYIITYIDKFLKKVSLTRIAGIEPVFVSVDSLVFNETILSDENIVGIPVKPNQKLLVFLSTENLKNISFPSKGIKLDTSDYKVIYQNRTYTLDEFFSTFVTNFSEYLMSFINETTIPINLGIRPSKPQLDRVNFKIVQINKHLTDAKSVTEIADLNKRKQSIQNEIDFKQTQINQLQNEVDTLKFKSTEEKNFKIEKIIATRQQMNILKSNLLGVTRDIDSNAIKNGLKTTKPKYKTIGFWSIQEPIYSPLTKPQHIIKYDVQYRYLSKNIDTVENTAYTMVSNGKEISVAFSPWNDLATKTLNKVENIDGKMEWETSIMDSVEDININQLAITISENESIEIRVRAVSEAGYPISPLKSEWSEIIRLDFPIELKQKDISSAITQNNTDLNKAEFESILSNLGLLNHVAGTIKEAEKTFHHHAKDIASGQYSEEQKNIPLDVLISNLVKEINQLKSSDITNNLTVQLVDFNNESFVVRNNTTMELFAGNYSDSINLLDSTKWGSIIRKKGYIKVRNNNNIPIEIKTLVPGTTLTAANGVNYYNVPIKAEDRLIQDPKQIIYFRNVDLTGQNEDIFKLVKNKLTDTSTVPRLSDIDSSVPDADKNVVYLENELIKLCKLNPNYNTDFIAVTTEHPLFELTNLNKIKPEFERLKLYTNNIKADQYQSEVNDTDVMGLGFYDNDFYAIGKNSCGSFLYPVIANRASIQVIGNTAVSTLIIPKESEILIPFIYEFRMIDRFGNINGELDFDPNNNLIYTKKIGIDMFLNNELFKFDINVISKLRSKVNITDSLNLKSITGIHTDSEPSNLD
jgi:hypothetical protein